MHTIYKWDICPWKHSPIWNMEYSTYQFRLKWTHSGNSQLRSKSVQQFWSNHIWCPASCQVRDRWGRIKLKHTYEQSPFSFKRGYTRSCSGLCTTYENSSEVARGLEVGDILLFREEIRGYTQGPRDPGTQEHTTPEGTGMIMTIQQPRYWEKIWKKKLYSVFSLHLISIGNFPILSHLSSMDIISYHLW